MFEGISLTFIIGPIILLSLVMIVVSNRRRTEDDPLKQAWRYYKFMTVMVGLISMVLWFSLSSLPVSSAFNYPKTVEDIKSAEALLQYLQEYNKTLNRIIEVVRCFLFIFVWWFLQSLYFFFESFRSTLEKKEKAENSPAEAS